MRKINDFQIAPVQSSTSIYNELQGPVLYRTIRTIPFCHFISYTYVPFHPVVSRRILLDHNPFLHGDPGQSMVLPVDCEDAGAEARCVRVGLEQPVSHEHQQACQDDGDYRPHDIAQSGTLIKCFGRFHGVHHPKSPLTFNGMASSSQTSQKIAADTNPSRQTPMSRNHNSQ